MTAPYFDVVVPVYRNADTVEELARRLHAALDAESVEHELIFVDDGCPQGSLAVLRRMAEDDPRVSVLALSRNVGQHAAVMVGLAFARGAWTAILDADLQDPPESLPELLAAAGDGSAVVFAGRRGSYEPRLRLLTSRLFKTLLHRVAGVPRDAGICMVLRRDAVGALLRLRTDRPFVVAMVGLLGLEMKSLPVRRSRRVSGRSAYSSLARLHAAWRAFACVYDCRRASGPPSPWSRPRDVVRVCYGVRFAP